MEQKPPLVAVENTEVTEEKYPEEEDLDLLDDEKERSPVVPQEIH